jgi:diguanylate cyclase (GGDEF)-like protein
LARLGAAARAIEQERRFRQQDGVDPLTGLMNRQALEEQIRRQSLPGGESACVVADLDLLGRINRVHGFAAGSEVIRAAARRLAGQADGAVVGSLGGGRFGVFFADAPIEEAAAWAERARRELAALEVPLGETAAGVTASFGAAAGSPEQVLRRAEDALREAKHSGRDYVACHGQFKDEELAWAELAAPGKLFEQTAAHHVMIPLPLVLTHDQTAGRAAELLKATRLDALCIVDPGGRLAGIVTHETDLSNRDAALMEVLDAEVAAFDESTPFATVFEFFTAGAQPLAVITRRGRPTGIITQEKLATLGEPASTARFAASSPYTDTSEYLVVVDHGGAHDTL